LGEHFSFTPTKTGTWVYLCDFHPSQMKDATIRVVAADGSGGDSGDGTDPSGGGGSPPGAGGSGTLVVDIQNFAFITPNGTDSITITLGQTIEFVNRDGSSHTATSTSVPAGASSFDSGRLRQGERFSFTPTRTGTWVYFCSFHPDQMKGAVITVVDSAGGGGAGSPPGGGGSPPGTVTIDITPSGYEGPSGTSDVTVSLGERVEWTNSDTVLHAVRSTDEPNGGTTFRSGDIPPGASFPFTPDVRGTWLYKCEYHGNERDLKITVQ
jgi:plastocyanin